MDGCKFVGTDVDAGNYVLNISIPRPAVGGKMTPVAQFPFTVPSEPAHSTLDLGEIVVKTVP
jgi:hypothetical protein